MMRGCEACGWVGRPRRLWCPQCGGGQWVDVGAQHGVLRALTAIERSVGGRIDPAVSVGLVELTSGGFVIVGVDGPMSVGDTVTVTGDGTLRAATG